MLIEPPQATPALLDRLCDGIRSQYESAVARLPVLGLGVVQSDGPERVVLSYVDSLGATEHQLSLTGIPDAVRPGASTVRQMTVPDGTGDASRLFDARVFMVGMPQPVRDRLPVRQVVIVPVPAAPTTTMIAALSTIESPTSDHIVDLTSIADQLSAVINQTE